MFRSVLNWKNAWHIRIVALGLIVMLVGVGTQVLVQAVAADAQMAQVEVTVSTRSGLMADGKVTYLGSCAVSLTQFSLGSIIALYDNDGRFDRECTAEDTDQGLQDGHIELMMPGDAAGAMYWGVRYLFVQVLRYGWGSGGAPLHFATSAQTDTLPLYRSFPRSKCFKSGL